MRVVALKLIGCILFLCASTMWGDSLPPSWFSKGGNYQIKLRVDLFLSSTCPHCHKADEFFRNLEANESWLEVHRYIINEDKSALSTFYQYLQQQKVDDFSVPAIFFCDSRWVGFLDAKNSGQELLRALTYCRQQIAEAGALTPSTIGVLKQWANANWLESSIDIKPSAKTFIPVMALTDAMNPCSMFGILALFSFLMLYQKRLLQLSIGFLFLVVSGLVHYVQQTQTEFFYQHLNWLRMPAIVIGLGLLAYILSVYLKGSAKKYFYIVPLLVALSALVIQAYQQTCTPNFALIFEQWLSTQQFPAQTASVYEIIYQLIYLLPPLLLVILLVFFISHRRMDRHQAILTHIAWLALTIIGVLLVIYPQWLANLTVSFIAFILSILGAMFLKWKSARG